MRSIDSAGPFADTLRLALGTALAAVVLLGGVRDAAAQDLPQQLATLAGQDSTMVDRVVAVVGDSVITLSQVLEEYQVAQQRGQAVEPRAIVEELVNIQLLLQAAARDSTIQVPQEEVDARVEAAVAEIRNRFPTELAFQQALEQQDLTPQQYRDQIRDRIRTDQIRQMFVRKHLPQTPAVAITEEEMRAFYEQQRASLQARPEALTIEQVFVAPTPSDSAWARARTVADSLRTEIMAGADFGELARAHSDDPSATEGGDMGWFRRGVMVREFERTAFQLQDNQVSEPVRTRYGYHLIKVEKRRPGEVKARHILLRPQVSDDDAVRATSRAEEVARRARAGEDMDSLRSEFGDEEIPGEIEIARDQAAQLPYPEGTLTGVTEEQVVGPVPVDFGGQVYQAVLRIADIREAGEFTFEDLRDQIRDELSRRKRIERIFDRLRASTYVDIRM